ncbi:hypothetical protein HK107_13265 [Parvularcula sp. ZS-1/3]|uniref:Uncharacterized protein n=1 Tax=Parvularcula mediterranea TaxID=2732508 RepID=A0A7Y3RNF2_9PROT|nr:hypothetical protein [Parvularcula mediterranea]NNU17294.1 hypothetical protein [Parvularcula mediterranea]
MPFDLYADAFVLMAALGAALYCLKLQRTLKKMQRTESGIGAALTTLAQATEASSAAVEDLREQLQGAVRELDERAYALKDKRVEIDDLLDTMEGQMVRHLRQCEEARTLTEDAITPLMRRAELEIQALSKALEVSARMSKLNRDNPHERDDHHDRSRPADAHDTASNPFLKAVAL